MPGIMSPRARKPLDPRSPKLEVRFAIQLRALVDKRGWGPTEFHQRVQGCGVDVTIEAVKKWLNGGAVPRSQDLEKIAPLFGMADYRKLLPPPPA